MVGHVFGEAISLWLLSKSMVQLQESFGMLLITLAIQSAPPICFQTYFGRPKAKQLSQVKEDLGVAMKVFIAGENQQQPTSAWNAEKMATYAVINSA